MRLFAGTALAHLLPQQAGVVTRAQLLDAGLQPHDVRRLLRRRDLVPLHQGVYLDHTGTPTWEQRAWGAVLLHWPAALSHTSALMAVQASARRGAFSSRVRDDGLIHLAVERNRSRARAPGIRLHRTDGLAERVRWNASPPRVKFDELLIDLATSAADDLSAIGYLADGVQSGWTSAERLESALAQRSRAPRRRFLAAVLGDVRVGANSVLEQAYLSRVERAHALPRGARQVRARGPAGGVVRDVVVEEFGLVVELDGRAFHDGAARRDADLARDVAAAVDGLTTLRLGWGQVVHQPCRTAAQISELLVARGWRGTASSCAELVCAVGVTC